jgi:hypothetical protein
LKRTEEDGELNSSAPAGSWEGLKNSETWKIQGQKGSRKARKGKEGGDSWNVLSGGAVLLSDDALGSREVRTGFSRLRKEWEVRKCFAINRMRLGVDFRGILLPYCLL